MIVDPYVFERFFACEQVGLQSSVIKPCPYDLFALRSERAGKSTLEELFVPLVA